MSHAVLVYLRASQLSGIQSTIWGGDRAREPSQFLLWLIHLWYSIKLHNAQLTAMSITITSKLPLTGNACVRNKNACFKLKTWYITYIYKQNNSVTCTVVGNPDMKRLHLSTIKLARAATALPVLGSMGWLWESSTAAYQIIKTSIRRKKRGLYYFP